MSRGATTPVRPLAALVPLLVALLALTAAPEALADEGSRRDSALEGRIAVGGERSCAIAGDGTLRCWGFPYLGYGNSEVIGDDEAPSSAGPLDIGVNRTAVEVTAGNAHTCAILDNGSVRCWGVGAQGRPGYGNTLTIGDDETPGSVGTVDLGAGRTAVDIAAGYGHTCAILDNGSVRCWGGSSYALGYGNTNDIGDDETPGSVGPVSIGAGRTAVDVAAGQLHTCVILDTGQVRCWGHDGWGQLGIPGGQPIGDNEVPSSVPPVDLGAGRTAVAIAAGESHTCAILDTGGVKCWGKGEEARLGYGAGHGSIDQPATVGTVDLGAGRTAVEITAGVRHTCALLDNGDVRCWGVNEWALLGSGNTWLWGAGWIGDDETPGSVPPVDLGLGRKAVDLVATGGHTCALLDDGTLRCWGAGYYGQLGYQLGNFLEQEIVLAFSAYVGDNETPGSMGPIDVGGGHGALDVVAGTAHSCALFDQGTVRCWGRGADGRLGYGNTNTIGDDESPGAAGTVDFGGPGAVELAAGDAHTCALLADGTVRCWGRGADGRLGYGNANSIGDDETPASAGAVPLGRTAVAIAAGDAHTCALLSDGTARCWGLGTGGRLGYAGTASIGDDETPASVGPLTLASGRTAIGISAGAAHTCVTLDDHSVRCWGLGANGRLGYGGSANIGDDEVAGSGGAVSLGSTAWSVAGGGAHSCAVLGNATMRCWGLNGSGQLGLGHTQAIGDNELPTAAATIGLGRSAALAAAGASHTCAILDNGAVRCWGDGADGRLGYGNTNAIGDNEAPAAVGTVALGGGHSAIALAAGGAHTCAALDNGTVRCWGRNADGQLGLGNTEDVGDDETPDTVPPADFVDDPPQAANDTAGTVEDAAAATIDVLDNDTDPDGGPFEIAAAGPAGHGTVTVAGDGRSLSYAPDPDYCGSDSFTYTLAPGASTATVSVTVTCVDDAPLAVDDSTTLGEDAGATTLDVLANDTDVDAGPRSIAAKSDGAHGTVTIAGDGKSLTYSPAANYCGPDSFTYTLAPGGATATVSVTVTCVDDLPAAADDTVTLAEDSGATELDVLANDTDPDGGPRSIANAEGADHGSVELAGDGASLSYEPGPNYCGPDSFTYTLAPGGATATVSVTVTCVDDPPAAADDGLTVAEDSGTTTVDVLDNDTDVDGGPKAVASVGSAEHGTVARLGGGAAVTYAPAPNHCGADSFTYTLNGGSTATVSVTVTCVDDPPVAVNDSATVAEGAGSTPLDVLANDTDVDGGEAMRISAAGPAGHGDVVVAAEGASLSYEPDPNYCGADSFTYTLAPGGSSATVSVTVSCVDDPPLAVDDSATLAEDAGATAIDVLDNDTDVDGGPKSVASVGTASHGTVVRLGGGVGLTYAPDSNYCGADSFTYTLAPGGSTATVSVTVSCVDDPPAAANDSATLAEDSGATTIDVLGNDTDPDGGPRSIAAKSNGAHGGVTIAGDGKSLSYAPDPNYCGADSFTYTLNGGSTATVSVTVTCVDDNPTAVADSRTLAEDSGPVEVNVLANDTDPDGGPRSIAAKSNGAHGTVTLSGEGSSLTYAPDSNYCGADSFTYTLAPGGSTATVSVTVSCVDDPPAAANDSATLAEDSGATTIDVLANDTDPDGGPRSIAARTNGSRGTVAIAAAGGSLSYAPAADYCGPDSFTYTLAPGGSTATVSVNVTCVDDAPRAVDDSATVLQGSSANPIDVIANDTDPDGGPKAVVARGEAAHGVVVAIAGGAGLAYTPAAEYCGPDSFTYTLNGGSTATVAVSVSCVSTPPPTPPGGDAGDAAGSSTTIVQNGSAGPVVNVTPGVGVVSGRRRPRIAIKGSYAFFTLTCKLKDGDCVGKVQISATIPSLTLGKTRRVKLVNGRFRIGASRSVLVRAKLTPKGLENLRARPNLRGVAGHMRIVDTRNDEQGEIGVTLVKRPKASLLE